MNMYYSQIYTLLVFLRDEGGLSIIDDCSQLKTAIIEEWSGTVGNIRQCFSNAVGTIRAGMPATDSLKWKVLTKDKEPIFTGFVSIHNKVEEPWRTRHDCFNNFCSKFFSHEGVEITAPVVGGYVVTASRWQYVNDEYPREELGIQYVVFSEKTASQLNWLAI